MDASKIPSELYTHQHGTSNGNDSLGFQSGVNSELFIRTIQVSKGSTLASKGSSDAQSLNITDIAWGPIGISSSSRLKNAGVPQEPKIARYNFNELTP